MPLLLALTTLLLLMAGLVVLRFRWQHLKRPTRFRLLALAIALILPAVLAIVTGWQSTSVTIDNLLLWLQAFGYVLIVVFFTLLRPRWLSIGISVILLLPLLSSSSLAPLSILFTARPYRTVPIGSGYYLETAPWTSGPGENSGVEYTVFYRPGSPGFFRRGIRGGRLYESQCRTAEAFGTLDSEANRITLHCPALTPQSPEFEQVIPVR